MSRTSSECLIGKNGPEKLRTWTLFTQWGILGCFSVVCHNFAFFLDIIASCEFWVIICEFTSSDPWVASSNPQVRVQIYELRVQIHKLRAQMHQLRIQIHKFKNHSINENSSKQLDELVRIWTYLCGLSEFIWRDMQSESWSYTFFKNYFGISKLILKN